ncbi:MAG: SDR family oxidoreductase [Dehalococcoidia bacterium]|nr:SDR family oxidoreductase [Dehalococcoidia bacterium]
MRIKDRVAIITGGGSGIGRGTCLRLAEEGGRIAVFDLDFESASETASTVQKAGGDAFACKVDVSRSSDVEQGVNEVLSRFGKVDILVNNAGMSLTLSIAKTTEELWDRLHDVNVKGIFLCCHAVLPHMRKQRYGKIVNIASIVGNSGTPGMVHYGATKAGVIGFTRGLATEVGPFNITVNAVGPGIINTPMLDHEAGASTVQMLEQKVPLRRIGEPRDIANAVLFFSSDDSAYVTGQCLFVCGG